MGRYKDPSTGTWKKEYAMPIGDTLPIGSEVDYDGSVVPYGWEETSINKITFTPQNGQNFDGYGNCFYYKKGGKVHIHLGLKGLTANTLTRIINLPEGYKPDVAHCESGIGASATKRCSASIYTSGGLDVLSEDEYALIDLEYDIVDTSSIKKIRQSLGAIGKVADSYTTDSNACYNAPYVNSLQANILWTNSSPTSSFAAQDITVNNLGNYDFYEVIFIAYADSSSQLSTRNFISTGRIPKGYRTRLMWFDEKLRYRNITNVTDSILGFSNGGVYDTYGSSSATSSNAICIPYQVLGYK